ncbi:MAG TPA: carboxypeptidase regulatory-like domain-containing protein [Bryobacteraceae bacterium]|nr:carboxypeptidase regulatory-like domain-containing protein [Bryobacteraceae bacterium]
MQRLLYAAIVFCAAQSALAQLSVSTIRGTATDPSGAAVAKAAVTILNLETNLRREVLTSENGDFEVPDLQRGTYRLSVTAGGFRNFVADNIILESNQIRRINVPLELGSVGSEVTVQAAAAVISTDSSKIQAGFATKTFQDAPLIGDGRNPGLLLSTLPHVQTAGSIYGVQMAGQSGSQIQEGIDGHTSDGVINQVSNIHDMQELVAVPVNNSAEFSRVGYFNMITKSGTNSFHGEALYWMRNSALDARDFFAAQKPQAKSHTMHGEISGPVFKNKTFFYASYSGQRWPGGTYFLQDVPTTAMRQGDFSQLLGLSRPVVIKDPLSGNPFPGNMIPANRLNATALKVQSGYVPTPNLGAGDALSRNFGFLWPWPGDLRTGDYWTGRVDHQLTSKNRIYGRVLTNWIDYALAASLPTLGWTRNRRNRHITLEDTHIFSATLVNTFRFGFYGAVAEDGGTVDGFTPQRGDKVVKDLGLQGVNPRNLSAMGFPRMDITGYPTLRNQPGGLILDDRDWGYADSVTWSKGRHVLKFGGEVKPFSRFDGTVPEGTYGSFAFNGSLTGYAYSDFLLGLPYSSQRLDPLTNRTRLDSEIGFYAVDTFKVNNRLTLDLGLRWERFGAATYDDGLIYNWDPVTGAVIVPADAAKSVSPLYPTNTIKLTTGEVKQRPSMRNWAPRIGAAWRPAGDNFVVRGSYGVFTETLGLFARALSGGPYQISETFFNSLDGRSPLFSLPNPFPPGTGSIPTQSISGYPLQTRNGRIHQFNVTIERQIHDIGLRVSYLGSRSRDLNYTIGTNKPQPSLIPFTAAARPYAQFVSTSFARSDGAANYNALTFEAQRKVGQLTFDAHWTWASNYNNFQNLENPYAPRVWSRDAFTSRHRVVLNAVWEVPVGRGRKYLGQMPAVADRVLGGWQLYWITFLESGSFFSPAFSGSDPSNTNTSGGLPDRIANGNLPPERRTIDRWFDAAAFTVPPAGRFGNSGVNVLEGPGRHEHDVTILKKIPIYERLSFSYGAAITNLFNHPNFNNPSANISAPGSVGRISSTKSYAPARQIMMRVRLDF